MEEIDMTLSGREVFPRSLGARFRLSKKLYALFNSPRALDVSLLPGFHFARRVLFSGFSFLKLAHGVITLAANTARARHHTAAFYFRD